MPHRYYCPTLQVGEISLPKTEAQHAIKVMRNSVGDTIELFDGNGGFATAVVTEIERRNVTVIVKEVQQVKESDGAEIVVAVASPRGDRMKWMVEKLTELGVNRCIPLETERSVTYPGQGKLSKLEATVISACKQCRRLRAMEICQPQSLSAVLGDPDTTFWLAHPEGRGQSTSSEPKTSSRQTVLIGPEGGFTDGEIDTICQKGANLISWPKTILRIETAAIMSVIAVQNRLSFSD